ncbi:MAG: metalloregulator ArsR/SmtB family transcription factor [Candidatus Promineifilaceae bacterium]|nr:winged helix-turn-helix transcriptional regulator [Anaerolineaceae bacterium]
MREPVAAPQKTKETPVAHPPLEELTILYAGICQALSDPKRILILYALNERARHVNDLAADLELPQPTVSRHLRVLRQQSLVLTEREGIWTTYRLADHRIIQVLDTMRQVMFDGLKRKTAVFSNHKSA